MSNPLDDFPILPACAVSDCPGHTCTFGHGLLGPCVLPDKHDGAHRSQMEQEQVNRFAAKRPACDFLIRDGQTTIGACELEPGHVGEHQRGAWLTTGGGQ